MFGSGGAGRWGTPGTRILLISARLSRASSARPARTVTRRPAGRGFPRPASFSILHLNSHRGFRMTGQTGGESGRAHCPVCCRVILTKLPLNRRPNKLRLSSAVYNAMSTTTTQYIYTTLIYSKTAHSKLEFLMCSTKSVKRTWLRQGYIWRREFEPLYCQFQPLNQSPRLPPGRNY